MKLTDGTENDAGKSIAEYEFKNTGDKQQQAAEENDWSAIFLLNRAPVIMLSVYLLHESHPVPTRPSPGH